MDIGELKSLLTLKPQSAFCDEAKMDAVRGLRAEIRSFIDELNVFTVDFINDCIDAPFDKWVELERMPWLKGKCVVGVMGRYATGKTTLLNSLLGLNLPIDSEANTAIPTYIAHGVDTEYFVLEKTGDIKKMPAELVHIIDHQYSDNFPYSSIIDYMVLNQRSDLLKRISFLDTPGISKDTKDMRLTASVVSQCNVAFWLIRATDGQLDAHYELPFIKESISGISLYVVLTFTDQCFDVAGVEHVIANTLKREGVKFKGILKFTNEIPEMSDCLNEFSCVLAQEVDKYAPLQPAIALKESLSSIRGYLTQMINEESKRRDEIEKRSTGYLNRMKGTQDAIVNGFNSSTRELNALIGTVNDKCSNHLLCNSTYTQLSGNLSGLIDKYNNVVGKFNEFDISEVVEYGKMSVLLEHCESKIETLTAGRNKCIDMTKKIENILKG